MKKFRTKKRNGKFIWYVGLFLISVAFSIKYLYREDLINSNTLIDLLISDFSNTESVDFTDVDFLLKYALNIEIDNSKIAFNEVETNKDSKSETEIEYNEFSKEPLVYIYNTHQSEKYQSGYLENYNITSTVLIASKILKEYLQDLGINVIVEEDDISAKLHSLNWKYGYSYKVSRMFMEDAKKKNPSLTYFIDLHRDSSKYDKTTTEINGEKYAKILFVVGLDHDNYEPNLKLAENLSEILKKYNEKLYRGIMKKSGSGVNGIYNQDFSPNTMLIEVGGQYNNISEVNNALKIFAQVLYDYIKDDLNA